MTEEEHNQIELVDALDDLSDAQNLIAFIGAVNVERLAEQGPFDGMVLALEQVDRLIRHAKNCFSQQRKRAQAEGGA